MEPDWRKQAECLDADPEIFFPESGSNGREAVKVCARCPVSTECLNYAMFHKIDEGVWGGKSAIQRHRLKMSRIKEAAA